MSATNNKLMEHLSDSELVNTANIASQRISMRNLEILL